jgi:hypothetical protein
MMSRSEQYRHNGGACLALAAKSRSEEDRECWRSLAQGWFDLAKNTDDRSSELKK